MTVGVTSRSTGESDHDDFVSSFSSSGPFVDVKTASPTMDKLATAPPPINKFELEAAGSTTDVLEKVGLPRSESKPCIKSMTPGSPDESTRRDSFFVVNFLCPIEGGRVNNDDDDRTHASETWTCDARNRDNKTVIGGCNDIMM